MPLTGENAELWRLVIFLGTLVFLIAAERLIPLRDKCLPAISRWRTNLVICVLGAFTVKILVPLTAIQFASYSASEGWGILSMIELHYTLELLIAVVFLDMMIYLQHRAFHYVPVLWRIHKVHHADRDVDVTTALRFHPIEIVISMLYKFVCIAVIGAPALAVFMFEALLNACAMFNHANLKIPKRLDQMLRALIVTPDMHRIHHSVEPSEMNSNFGFCLSLWDKLFASYSEHAAALREKIIIGLDEHQNVEPSKVFWSLSIPFQPRSKSKIQE